MKKYVNRTLWTTNKKNNPSKSITSSSKLQNELKKSKRQLKLMEMADAYYYLGNAIVPVPCTYSLAREISEKQQRIRELEELIRKEQRPHEINALSNN